MPDIENSRETAEKGTEWVTVKQPKNSRKNSRNTRNRKRWRQTGSRQSTPYRRYGPDNGNSVSTPESTRICKTQQNSLRKGKETDTEFQYRPRIVDTDTIADAISETSMLIARRRLTNQRKFLRVRRGCQVSQRKGLISGEVRETSGEVRGTSGEVWGTSGEHLSCC